MTTYYEQIKPTVYLQLLDFLPVAHTYNGITQQLVIIHCDNVKELDKLIVPILYADEMK